MLEEWDFVEVPPPESQAAAAATQLVAGDLTATVIEDTGYGRPGILIHVEPWGMNIVVSKYSSDVVHVQTYGPEHGVDVMNLFSGRDDLGAKNKYISLRPTR